MSVWFKKYDLETLKSFNEVNMLKHLGIEITEIDDYSLSGTMPVDHRTMQPMGLLHGGASCVLAESLGSIAGNLCLDTAKQYAVGQSISTNHISSIKTGTVSAKALNIHKGKSSHIWEIDITNHDRIISKSILTLAVRDIR